ncbi:MAG: molybdopterin-synthase adenylyltransferase MoeB [Gemmatimonadota bacterium]
MPADTSPYQRFSTEERLRYSRHFVLKEVGPEGQLRLRDASVLVVGAGGLGSPVALYLAAAGVGTLGLVDFDQVDLSNLQRQLLHGTADVGRSKLESARDRLRETNPHVEVVPHPVRLSSQNALQILEAYDVVVDGSDNFPTRYLVNDACVFLKKPLVYGSILRWEGQLAVFAGTEPGCYRCLFREPPPPGLVPNCAEGGIMGMMAGVVGSLQALEAVKLILGEGDTLKERLLLFDGLELSFREIRVRPNPDCPVCSAEPTQTELLDYELFCGVLPDEASPGVEEVEPQTLMTLLEGDYRPLLLDVRERWEWEAGNLSYLGSIHIPRGELSLRADELPSHQHIVTICRSGVRSRLAAESLASRGFPRVTNLRGGLDAWIDAGLPDPAPGPTGSPPG